MNKSKLKKMLKTHDKDEYDPELDPANHPKNCRFCGTKIPGNVKWCDSCGVSMIMAIAAS